MSNALWVFCREEPDLPSEGALDGEPVTFAVRPATAEDEEDAQLLDRTHEGTFGGSVRVQAGEMAWVVELDFPSRVEFDAFHAGGTVIAMRSGGGLLWSPVAGKVIEVVDARPDGGRADRPLLDAVARAFETMAEDDW